MITNRDIAPDLTLNEVRYVNVNAPGAANQPSAGKHPDRGCFASLAYAVTQVPADTLIRVIEGHTEDIETAHAWDFAAAGIWVQGRGWKGTRPTFTFKTSVDAQVKLDQSSCVLENLLFVNEIDALVNPILLDAEDCALFGVEIREDTAVEAIDYVVVNTAAHRCEITDLKIKGEGSGDNGESGINVLAATEVLIKNPYISGGFGTAAIENETACTEILVVGGPESVLWNKSADVAYTMAANATGSIKGPTGVRLATNTNNITEALVPGKCQVFDTGAHFIGFVNADGEADMQWNGDRTTDAA
jgi:hypothetical protein